MRLFKEAFWGWKQFDYILFASGMMAMVIISLTTKSSGWVLTMICAFFSLTAGMLNYKGKKMGFLVYIFYAALYTYMSFNNHLYGEAILYGVYALPMYTYSTVKWLKNIKKDREMPEGSFEIYRLDMKTGAILLLLGGIVIAGYGYVLGIMGSDLPYLNSTATVCSALAIYLTNKRYKEQWYAWLSYSFVFAAIWLCKFTLAFGVQSIVFIIINICGMINWKKTYENQIRENR